MPYWITSTLTATPLFLWVFFGLGIPWALALLPRKDWQDRPLVLALALACGPALLTAWMFILGTLGSAENPLLRFDLIIAGTFILALIGAVLAWRKRNHAFEPASRLPLAFDERLLIALIAAAFLIRWLGIAYWPFTAYDALWVYGYQGRLYTVLGYIPDTIGYYPQFLPLQFTFVQLALGGIDDHAARAGLILLQLGSVLATYTLASRLFNRRVGIFAAALWALYPHMGEWSRFGDLEIPVTFSFTLAAAFFMMAWMRQQPRRRYALIAGFAFGIAMWTKPTAGAFVWGVLLLLAAELVRLRFNWRAWLPRFEVAFWTGVASAPLGGVWYVRNVLLGHPPIELPPGFWQTLAQRSGVELGWPLLALTVIALYLGFNRFRPPISLFVGLALMFAGALPSVFWPHHLGAGDWLARTISAPEILSALFGVLEWALLLIGGVIYARALLHTMWENNFSPLSIGRGAGGEVAWALLLVVPYFITWFFSYSYHYRLSFAMVPILILPTAVTLACWIKPQQFTRPALKFVYTVLLIALAIPGAVIALYDVNAGWDWLWTDKMPDDWSRYLSGNAALMDVVHGLNIYLEEHDEPLVVVAPGVKRLPFFFPGEDIRIDETPTRFDELEGVVYFVESQPEGSGAYEHIPLNQNQVMSALNRTDIMRRAWWENDGIFRYDIYELHLENRFNRPSIHVPPAGDVVFGDFVRFLGHDIGGAEFWQGRRLIMHLYWEVLTPPSADYMIFIHLRDAEGTIWQTWDGPVARSEDGLRYYTTLVWEPGEFIVDERALVLQNPDTPLGEGYGIYIGFYDLATEQRVPMTLDGAPAGDEYRLGERLSVIPPQE